MPEGIREEPANTVPVPFVSDTGPVPSQRPQWQDGLQLHPLFLVHSAGSGSCPVVEFETDSFKGPFRCKSVGPALFGGRTAHSRAPAKAED